MKILLVKPISDKKSVLNIVPPIGLGYMATGLRKHGFEVTILDCLKERFNFLDFYGYIKKADFDLIGFQVYSKDIESVNKHISLVKKVNESIWTIVGGPHPSLLPEKTFHHFPMVDFGFKGESEVGISALVVYLSGNRIGFKDFDGAVLKNISGLIWKNGSDVVCNEMYLEKNLDNFDYPAWDLIRPNKYPDGPHGVFFRELPIAPIVTTRGCPFKCTFCGSKSINGSTLRKRSVESIIKEIELLQNSYGIREIHFLDDNFTFDKNFAMNVSREIIKRKIKINWCCPNGIRLDTLDEDLLKLMKESGCYSISVGIESGSQRILKLMKKGISLGQIVDKVNLIRKLSFIVSGFFIIGYPDETKEDIRETIKFSKKLDLDRAAFFNFLPLPGTEIYKQLIQSGEMQEFSWHDFSSYKVNYAPVGISKNRLKWFQRQAYLSFYLRPVIIYKLFKEIKTFKQVMFIVKRFFAYIF